MLKTLLLCSLLIVDVGAVCTICSLLSDYSDDMPTIRTLPEPSEKYRRQSLDSSERQVVGSFSDLVSTDDGANPLRGRGRFDANIERPGVEPKQKTGTQLFDLFDTIGSGLLQVQRLDGQQYPDKSTSARIFLKIPPTVNTVEKIICSPHICTRETTKRWPAEGNTLRSEKSCQRFRDANKCIDRRTDAEMTTEITRIEECCEGYETKDIFRHGCPKESTLENIEDSLEYINSSLWDIASRANATAELSKKNVTIFVSPEYEDEVSDAESYLASRIVPGTYRPYDWTDGTVLKTLSGGELIISQSEDAFGTVKSYVNCVPINTSSVRTQTGIIHVASGDVLPAAETVLAALEADPRFASFLSILSEDLRESLSSNESSFTVFAPSDKVLSSLSDSLISDIKERRGCASDFARSHVVNGSFCTSQLFHRRLNSLAGTQIDVHTQIKSAERVTHIGRAKIIGGEVFAKNGVVHLIDDVLFSDELMSWKEHLDAINSEMAKSLEDVMKNSTEPITIFVPHSDNDTVLNAEMSKNHVVIGDVLEHFQQASTITTEAGSKMFTGFSRHVSPIWMRISVQPQRRRRGQVACSRITSESVKGCRAVLQFIDKPLPLVTDNFESFLAKRADLSRFYRLWRDSSLNASLTDDKPLTAFVPSDDAFSTNEFKKLASEQKLAETFVRRHIVEEPLCNFDLRHSSGEIRIQTYANLNGEALRPSQTDGETFIDGARIEESEIVLTNGVLYVVESPIIRNQAVIRPSNNRRRTTNLFDIIH
ncbi:unnamed protein product [Cylicocyclus nassatus]|uniref:FAS1 domain-containing protein n=1 Tax=Cylicocyclus nassatus TaxID=53992 RepID=A0AA36H7R9_CYLNA|nr:unnamed protein product [Cylicocyclus nassatus]